MNKFVRKVGPFDEIARAKMPGQLPRSERWLRGRVEIVYAALPDPSELGRERLDRQQVALNSAGDVLLRELQHRRIDLDQFNVGRIYENAMERQKATGGRWFDEGSRASGIADGSICAALDRARDVERVRNQARLVCGDIGGKLLDLVLDRRMSFRAIASSERRGRRQPGIVAAAFRQALADLARDGLDEEMLRRAER